MTDYDAFISYSHSADGKLAPAIQSGLQRLAKPWSKRRALEVFRDETGLTVNPDLWASITDAMDRSEWFVLLASPDAAASKWVDQEVERWIDRGPEYRDRILPVVTGGTFAWDEAQGTFTADTDAAPPSLARAFDAEPLFTDLSWAHDEAQLDLDNPRFRETIAHIAAPMHGVTQDELIGEDVRQHRRTVRLRRLAFTSLAALTVGAVVAMVFAVLNAREADRQAAASRSRELAALAASTMDDDAEVAALLAVEALEVRRTSEAERAVRNTLGNLVLADVYRVGPTIDVAASVLAVSPDGATIATTDLSQPVEFWDTTTGERIGDPVSVPVVAPTDLRFSPDGSELLVVGADDRAEETPVVVAVTTREVTSVAGATGAATWGIDGDLWAVSDDGSITVRSGPAGAPTAAASAITFPDELERLPSGAIIAIDTDAGEAVVVGDGTRIRADAPNGVWAADPLDDVVHVFHLAFRDDSQFGGGVGPIFPVRALWLDGGDHPERVFAEREDAPIARRTLTMSDDGAFLAGVDGINEQPIADSQGASGVVGAKVHVWHPGRDGVSFEIETNTARDAAWIPGSRDLAVASQRGVELFRVNAPPSRTPAAWGLGSSADWSRVVTVDDGGRVRIWEPGAGAPMSGVDTIGEFEGSGEFPLEEYYPFWRGVMTVRADGSEVATVVTGALVVALDGSGTPSVRELGGPDGLAVTAPLVYSPSGDRLVVGSGPGLAVVDADTGAVLLDDLTPGDGSEVIGPVMWRADGSSVLYVAPPAEGPAGSTLVEADAGDGRTISTVPLPVVPNAMDVSPDGRSLAVGVDDGRLIVFDLASGQLRWSARPHLSTVQSVDFSADGERLVTADGTAVVTATETGRVVWSSDDVPAMQGESGWLLAEFDPDGRTIAVAGYDRLAFAPEVDPDLACRLVDRRALDRVEALIAGESACRGIEGDRPEPAEAWSTSIVRHDPWAAITDDAPVGPSDGEPPVPFVPLPDIVVPDSAATCPSFVDMTFLPVGQGDRGWVVAHVQWALAQQGADVAVDGCFGPATLDAVLAYQARTGGGLIATGEVGELTWYALTGAAFP